MQKCARINLLVFAPQRSHRAEIFCRLYFVILGTKQAQKENFWLSKTRDRDQRRSRPKMGAQASSYRKLQHLQNRLPSRNWPQSLLGIVWNSICLHLVRMRQHAFRISVCQISIPPTIPFKSFCPFAPVRPFLGAIFNFEYLSSLLDLDRNILHFIVWEQTITIEKIPAKIESSAWKG